MRSGLLPISLQPQVPLRDLYPAAVSSLHFYTESGRGVGRQGGATTTEGFHTLLEGVGCVAPVLLLLMQVLPAS